METIEIKIRVKYREEKNIKKFLGKIKSREISFGRRLLKLIKKSWVKNEIL